MTECIGRVVARLPVFLIRIIASSRDTLRVFTDTWGRGISNRSCPPPHDQKKDLESSVSREQQCRGLYLTNSIACSQTKMIANKGILQGLSRAQNIGEKESSHKGPSE